MEEMLELLKAIGMQEYESKAYIYLLQNGVSTADQVSNLGDIPLPRVYETLDSLHKRGIVQIVKSRPKKYHVVSVESVRALIEEKRERMLKDIEKSEEIFRKISAVLPAKKHALTHEQKQDFWTLKGRQNIIKTIIKQQKKSNKEILMFGGDLSWFSEFQDILREKIKEGASIKVLGNVNKVTRKTVDKMTNMGIEIRNYGIRGLLGNLIDGRIVQICTKIPRNGVKPEDYYGVPGNDKLFSYEAIETENPVMYIAFSRHFQLAWDKGKSPKEIFRKQGKE